MTNLNELVHWQHTPIEHIPIGRFVPPPVQHAREIAVADWLNIDPDLVYQAPFGGHPVILYPEGELARREWFPELDATAGWFPLLWPSIDETERYDNETNDEFALRILLDMQARGMYQAEGTGEWFPIWAVWESVGDTADGWTDRVNTWLDGAEDEILDDMEPSPLPEGSNPDQPYADAQARIVAVMAACESDAVSWALNATSEVLSVTLPVDQVWVTLCYVADALTPHSPKWAAWFDRELPQVAPVFEAAAATGARGSADRQAARLFGILRDALSGLAPLE